MVSQNFFIPAILVGIMAVTPALAIETVDVSKHSRVIKRYVRQHRHRPIFHLAANITFSSLPTTSYCVANYGYACYTASQLRVAYDVPSQYTGKGQKIAIVVAYGSPTIVNDIHVFDQQFGFADPVIKIFYPQGNPGFDDTDPDQLFWGVETTQDVELSHAIAPDAEIDIIVAKDDSVTSTNAAERYVLVNHIANILSLSYGSNESYFLNFSPDGVHDPDLVQGHETYNQMAASQFSIFAAAGDGGAQDWTVNGNDALNYFYPLGVANMPQALNPADDPNITAIGGTELFADDDGTYQYETVWNDTNPVTCAYGPCTYGPFTGTGLGLGAITGGSTSIIYPVPYYQKGVTNYQSRTTSDVSFNAGFNSVVWTYLSFYTSDPSLNGWGPSDGTSIATPAWAGIAALINEANGRPIGPLNPILYAIYKNNNDYAFSFHNITIGDNSAYGLSAFGPNYIFGQGFSAGSGYNLPTGLGTPDVAHLIQEVIKYKCANPRNCPP